MESLDSLLGMRYVDLGKLDILRMYKLPDRERIEDRSYANLSDAGVSLVLPDHETIGAVQLHAPGHEGFSGYPGPLPGGLTFDMDRDDVRNALGAPDRHGEEGAVLLLGKKPAWDSFALNGHRLHVEYAFGGRGIQLVTLTSD